MKPRLLLSDDVIETARQIYLDGESHQWKMGDFLVELVDELGENRGTRAAVFRQIANGIGIDSSTLRDREGMSRFYPWAVRKRYDVLTYHQLRACKSAGLSWQEYADWALENLPAPVALIRQRIKSGGNEVPAWYSRVLRLYDIANELSEDEQCDPDVREICRELCITLDRLNLIDQIESIKEGMFGIENLFPVMDSVSEGHHLVGG